MNKLQRLLKKKKVLVADGAWGTELIKRGLAVSDVPEVWNLENPFFVKEIAKSYRDADADIILTNTFGANRLKLNRTGFKGDVKEINRIGVELSKEEAGSSLVFASIGPTGELLKPLGNFNEADFIEVFTQQVKGLVEGKADGVIIETMSDVKEALCALEAVKKNSSLLVGVSFSFNKGHKGFATMMGLSVEQAVKAVLEKKPDIIGANCGSVTIEDMIDITRIMKKFTSLPLWIKSNAGLPLIKDKKTIYPQTPEEITSFIPDLIEAGAKIIGGCCGTTPEHIKKIREKVDQYFENSRRK
ncbi:MAG: homocysteine S-methyltransferase family protein [Candidatus Omnitrophica bacterium]|nr:homocysteine S-methyltransferase family protein [Candidatus Omnitrophota bacterium]MBU1048056.1 homocysteine S-methyltransferase family protein [Candidatus Omnitrophota bacterium]MBU1766524.1 homocysteine S-methyltransferase family protein [Candidatus Omnitrophota bacterium]